MSSKYQSAINKVNAIIENDKKQQAEQERMKNSRFASAYRKLGLLEDDTTDNTPVDESRRVNQIASNPKAELDRRESNKSVVELSSKTPLSAPNLSAFVSSRSPQAEGTKTTNPKNVLGSQFDLSSPLNQLKTHAVSTGNSEDINTNEIPQLSNSERLKSLMDKSSENTPAVSNTDRLKLLMDKSSENTLSSNENNGFFDRFVTDAKYIGEMGKVGLESGIDALKTTTKTFASSISDFLERLFPGKEVGNSGIKIPTIRQSTSPVMKSYAESQETGLQDVSTPIKSASSAFTAELTKNLDEYANTNTRQKKLEELQEKYSDDDIGTVTQFIADAANSIGYNLPAQLSNIFTSGLGGAMIMGTQSFSDAYSDARNSGATRQEALKFASQEAINQGALDTLFGMVGGSVIGDKLSTVGSAISSPIGKTAFEVGVNTVGEAAEEMLQSIVTTINQRTTYDKEATIDPSALAYEGLLGGTMGAFFGIASAPGKYKAYKTDYNLVNEFSKRASKVSTNEEADTVIKAGETLVKASDDIINNKGSSAEDVSRATYIKRGINESLDILSGYRDRIIIDNTAKNDIVMDIVYQPMSQMNQNLARLVNNIAESTEPGENAVNKTIDYIRDEIRFLRDNANSKQTSVIEKYALSDPEFRRNALIEIEKTLRQNREQIEAERNKLSDSQGIGTAEPAASPDSEIKTVADKSNGIETTGQQKSTSEVEENRNDPLTDKPVIDTIDAVEEKTSETSLSPENKHDFSLTYKQTKHTKSGETLNVFSINGKLSNNEYASLKAKMKDIGGYYSGFAKGFIVPADKVSLVSDFSDVSEPDKSNKKTESGKSAPASPLNPVFHEGKGEVQYFVPGRKTPVATSTQSVLGTLESFGKNTTIQEAYNANITGIKPVREILDHYISRGYGDVTLGDMFGFTGENMFQQYTNGNDTSIDAKEPNERTTDNIPDVQNTVSNDSETESTDTKTESTDVYTNDSNDVLVSSDKQQALAEGVIPGISPQSTTESPVSDGMQTETAASDSLVNSFYGEIADRVLTDYLEAGKTLTINDLQQIATTIYKGTLAEGAFSPKDMTDALELAVNHYIIKFMSENNAQYNANDISSAEKGLQWAEWILDRIPTQTKRTEEQLSLQQFSTPPNIAYLANWAANINESDFMLEPSAGIGGLASFAKAFGATTAVNEISERRLGALRALGFDHVFSENAEQLDNILPDYVKPTVVVMNPPFSSTGGRTKNSSANAKPHVEQALYRLENGGRLVAILGQGMSNDAPMFSGWWDKLRENYNIRANIGIDGSNYRKYGTTFNVRLVVIDKTGPQTGETITGDYKSLNDIPKILEGVRNDRTHTGTTESNGIVESNEGASVRAWRISESERTVSDTVSGNNASTMGSGNAMESGLSSARMGSIRSESDSIERVRSDAGMAVQGNDEQSGVRMGTSGNDGSVSEMAQGAPGGRNNGRSLGGSGPSDGDIPGNIGQSGNGSMEELAGGDGGDGGRITTKKSPPKSQKEKANTSDDGIYARYVPSKLSIKGAKPHPAVLVESSAMAAVAAPEITYVPNIAQDVIEKGLISDVQLENISYAGQAHEQMLENGTRKGYFIGDGTGVGKGRQAAGIILDNFNQGRRKALWISEKKTLMEDAKRDWSDIGGNPDDIFDIDGIRKGVGKGKNKKVPEEGILFVPYSTVKSKNPADKKTTNADPIIQWLGKDFDGVIIYDEAHNMNSLIPSSGARGTKTGAQQAIEANKIQESLPNARVVYMSATGATEVEDLCFASRLGLWGKGTQFVSAEDFSSKIGASGVAGMELVASSLKSMGVYQARSISFEGVRYDSVRHKLTKEQRQIYDTMSEAWQITLQNMEKAIQITGVKNIGNARGIFYKAMQNFYNQVLSSMATPSVIEDIKKELDAGHSCVIQLVNTNASQQEKELSKAKAEGSDLEELDITPRGALLGFLENSFPVQQYEEYLDEHGNKKSRPVFDSKGNPVLNKQAVAARDALIERINEMSIPDGPIDMILNAFGSDNVAEVTGRSRRVVNKTDENGNIRKVEENLKPDFRIAETTAFQNGEKRILIFSNAGSTGRSYHADKRAKNQQQRIHYILQPGWSAKTATQGFGRTHRSNQVIPPVYKLVQTDIEGQKRFVTSIARRLDQLGALTKGQRQTGSGIFGEKDNLESPLSRAALREFFKRLGNEQIDGINGRDVFTKLGLYRNFYDEYGNFTLKTDKSEDITTFLNRLLALKVDEQNIVFGEFETIRQQMYDAAIENGTLDTGISNVKADKITVNQENTIHTDEKTGSETKYVKATAYRKPVTINTVDDAIAMRGQFQGLRRMEDGSVRAVYRVADETDAMGRVYKKYLLQSPNRSIQSRYRENKLLSTTTEIPKEEWDSAWSEELKNVPAYNESTLHIITGDILSVWNKLPQDGNIKAMKIVTDDGSQILGRIIPEDRIDAVLRGMDIKQKNENLTGQQIYDAIIKSGKEAVFSQSYSGKNTIKRSRVSGENRIEVTGSNLWSFKQTYPDIIVETIQYEKRYFIPTGEKGVKILDDIVSKNNVSLTTKNENSLFFSKSNGKWGSGEQNSEKIKSVSDLQREATRIFGVQINTGKVGGKGTAGVFNTHANTIRTRVYGDIPTIAHEIGHWFDKRYRMTDSPEIDEIIGVYQSDLEEAGYNESVFPNEAIAYYFADLMRNKQNAETIAPDFSAWLDDILSYSDKKRLSEYVDMCNAYHSADTMQRRGAQIRYRHKDHSTVGEARFQVDTFRRNPAAYLGNLSKRFVRIVFDDILDLKPFGKTYDLSMKERTANSIVSGRLNIAFTDNEGNVIGKSLSAILQEGGINDLNHNDFNAYLVARVALDRIEAAENGENVATLVYADTELQDKSNIIDAIQTYERNNPTFADTAKGVYEYQNNLLDIAVDAGIISESLSDYFKKTFPHYVPLYRSMDKNAGISSGRGKKTPKAPIARFKGSGRDIYAPIENIAIQTENFTKSILQNEVRTEFANFIDSHEDMGWAAEKIPESKIFDTVTTDEIEERLAKFDSDKLDSLNAFEKTELFEELMSFIGDTTGMWKAATRQGENVISVLRNGKREYYEIHDEDLMKAMLTMTPRQYGFILKAIGSATSTFKILTTGSNPRYGFTNVSRDITTGYISSKTTNNPFKYVMDFISSFGEAIVESDGYKEFLRSGGGYQGALTMDMQNLKHQYSGLVKSHSKMKSFIQSAVGFIPRFIDAGESASHYAEFKRARQQGIDGLEALRMAQEVTVNFQRHGSIGKEVDKFIPYFNASLQSLYHYYDTLFHGTSDQKKTAWIKFVSSNTLLAALGLAWNYIIAPAIFDKEDEPEKEYAKLSNYNKNAYWCFYAGNGEFVRIAKPKDMMVFSTLIERAVEYYADENPSAFYNFGNYLASAFFPPAFDDAIIIGTVLSLAKNETFTGAPIVPSAYQNLSPELQYNEKTSALSIALGSLLNLSPMQIDFVIDDTTGFVGDFILNLTKSGGTSVKDVLDLNDRLVPNVLMTDNVYSTDAVSIFYETKDKYDTNKASYKATSGENDKYTAYDVYGSYKYGKIADLYSSVNKLIKTDTNEQSSRDTRSVLNDLIRSVNNTESTDIDKAVSELAERTGTEVSDIAPYIVVPTSLKDAQKNEYVLDAYDMMEYYTESQILFQVWYQKVLDSGYDDAVIADALASLKKEIKRQMDDRYLYKLREK